VQTLRPFGKKYVDQFAMAYLAFEEKSYLPTIVSLVASAIKKDSGREAASAAAMDGDPNTDLIGFAMSEARASAEEQVLASPAVNHGVIEKFSVMSKAPQQAEPAARGKLAVVQSDLKTAHSLREAGGTERPHDRGGGTGGRCRRGKPQGDSKRR
jgi:hypothetical protein